MYKCKDCGQEYKTKPDYCDCGNNTFDEIIPQESQTKKTNKTVYEYNKVPKTGDKRGEIFSWIIFSLCIILSVLSLIFIGRGNENNSSVSVNVAGDEKAVLEIPSIEDLWVDSASKIKSPEPIDNPNIFQSIFVKPQVQVAAKVDKAVKNMKKVTSSTQSTVQSNQPAQQGSMTEEQKAELVKRLTENKTVSVEKSEPVVDEAALKKELMQYKTALRNRIAANIDFTRVIGDGSCAVTFKIDSSGNLIERNFSTQSKNSSLNDVVYYAMMQNPAFQAPPKGYKDETLTLSVKMYGGNFEVTLK